MKKQTKIIAAVAALVVVVALLMGLYTFTRPETQAGTKEFTVVVVHGNGESKQFNYRSDEEFVGTVLIEDGLIQGSEGEWGMYISHVEGERAVYEEDGAYWAFYVGEEYATESVELTPIEDGATYQLVYTPA